MIHSRTRSLVNVVRVNLGSLMISRRQTILDLGRWVGLFVFGFAILLLLWNQIIRFEHRTSDQNQDILLFASYPQYLPTDDLGGIIITVANTSQRPITDTVVSLVCGDTAHICLDFDSTSRIQFGHLEPNERKTKLIKFQINRIDSFAQKVQIDLDLSAQHSTTVTTPLQHSATVTTTLQRSAVVTTTLQVRPTVVSFLPIGVTLLVLNRTFTIPNLVVALAECVKYCETTVNRI